MDRPKRKQMRRREVPGDIRFITFSCEGRLPLLGHPGIRDLFERALGAARERAAFELFAWAVMPEHAHLLARPRAGTGLERALRSIKVSVAKRVIARWQRLKAPILDRITHADGAPRFWLRGGGFDRNVRSTGEFKKTVQYIHRNPVTRGLVERPEVWRWSSVRWWMGERDGELTCDPPPGGPAIDWSSWRGFK